MSPQSTRFARVIGAILAVLAGYQFWAFWYGGMPPHIRLWLLLMALSTGVAPVGPQPIRGLPRIEIQLQIVVDLFTASICTIGTWLRYGLDCLVDAADRTCSVNIRSGLHFYSGMPFIGEHGDGDTGAATELPDLWA